MLKEPPDRIDCRADHKLVHNVESVIKRAKGKHEGKPRFARTGQSAPHRDSGQKSGVLVGKMLRAGALCGYGGPSVCLRFGRRWFLNPRDKAWQRRGLNVK